MNTDVIKSEIRNYIKGTIAPNKSSNIDDATLLITDGIMDSISTLKLVDFLEKQFGIEFQPHDVDRENLDSINMITEFVLSKK